MGFYGKRTKKKGGGKTYIWWCGLKESQDILGLPFLGVKVSKGKPKRTNPFGATNPLLARLADRREGVVGRHHLRGLAGLAFARLSDSGLGICNLGTPCSAGKLKGNSVVQ